MYRHFFRSTIVAAITLPAATEDKREQVRGHYPSGQRYQGFKAEHYYRMMLDADRGTYMEGIIGLQKLGAEGVPYLLDGIVRFQQTGQKDHLFACLQFCDPRVVDAVDLPIFVRLLHTDAGWEALRFFVRPDGAGRTYLADLCALLNDPPASFADPNKRGWGRAFPSAGSPLPIPPAHPANEPSPVTPPRLRDQFIGEVRAVLHRISPEQEPNPGESPHERVIREYNESQAEQREAKRREIAEQIRRNAEEREKWLQQRREENRSSPSRTRRGPMKPPQRPPS